MKARERDIWKYVVPGMMSEEEEFMDGDISKFRILLQSWKSQRFSRFLSKLDERLKKTNKHILARGRCYGDPVVVDAPASVKPWMTGKPVNLETEVREENETSMREENE